jgi:hypothetical protein
VQEEGSLPSERSGEGGAKRRSAQAKRGRLGCLLRAPEAEPLRKALVSLHKRETKRIASGTWVRENNPLFGHSNSGHEPIGYFLGAFMSCLLRCRMSWVTSPWASLTNSISAGMMVEKNFISDSAYMGILPSPAA